MVKSKGAFQLSLGFIITVVFAVVLLSVALLWLQGVLGGIGGLTDDLTQGAREKIIEGFKGKEHRFGIYPSSHVLTAGRTLKMSAGIDNSARDNLNHHFVINVVPVSASRFVLEAECGTANFCNELRDKMDGWIQNPFRDTPVPELVNKDEYTDFDVIINPEDAVSGTYIFNFYACYNGELSNNADDVPNYDDCSSSLLGSEQDKLYGSSQRLSLTIA